MATDTYNFVAWKSCVMWLLCSLVSSCCMLAGTLAVEIRHSYGDQPLLFDSLKYRNNEVFSLTRLSYLISEVALLKKDGSRVLLDDQYAYIDVSRGRDSFELQDVPIGKYVGLRFFIGVPQRENHTNPAQWEGAHPLNPNVNQMHWSWQGGYIFMAMEGKYRESDATSLHGYVYHLANDANYCEVQLGGHFQVKKHTQIRVGVDVQKILHGSHSISFKEDGASTHSHEEDPIAKALVSNLSGAWSYRGALYPQGQQPLTPVRPLYLPEHYTPYAFKMSKRFSVPALPRDNPLLEERVSLGKKLFHDKRLSRDFTVSCASCHDPAQAFSDNKKASLGVRGQAGRRNSMPLFNLAWKSQFFWDGRARSLREQVLMPIHDPVEMDLDFEELVTRLGESADYSYDFERAFSGKKITAEKIALALENFLLSLTSYSSKFDRAMNGEVELTASEKRGMELFFTEYEPRSGQFGADCFHCHGGANFSDHRFHNNGLVPNKGDFGLFEYSAIESDRGKFATPSLRNLSYTAPYMHDGRFQTLEEVVEHYSGPMHDSKNLDVNLAKHPKGGLALSAEDKAALVAFLKTLNDPSYVGTN